MAPSTIEEVVSVELAFWDSIKDSGALVPRRPFDR